MCGNYSLRARKGVSAVAIKSLLDLRGRPVGVTRFGASTDFTLRHLLPKSGLEPGKDVAILQLGGQPELTAALESGHIAGAITPPPAMTKMVDFGARVLIPPQKIGLRFPHVGIVARKSFLRGNRALVENFLKAYSEGVALLIRDRDAVKPLLQSFVGSADPRILESTWQYANDTLERIPYPDPEGIRVVLQDRARTRPEAVKLSYEQFIDASVIQELERDGFYKNLFGN